MVQFKIYDKNLKKFVELALVGDKVWKDRYSLGIWNDGILPQSLEKMSKTNYMINFEIVTRSVRSTDNPSTTRRPVQYLCLHM